MEFILPFSSIRLTDLSKVGGKNASLGEMTAVLMPQGIPVPEGFAITADAYKAFLVHNDLELPLMRCLAKLTPNLENLGEVGAECRALIAKGKLPDEIKADIVSTYGAWGSVPVAVRSSATAEDLPSASFAGQHDSFLNIVGEEALLEALLRCYISLFNDRAIKYRIDHGFKHMDVLLSVGIQRMVRSDLGSAGVSFTVDPETGFNGVVYITSAWGLGENVVQGAVSPDEFYLSKVALEKSKYAIVRRHQGAKETRLVYSDGGSDPLQLLSCTPAEQLQFSLTDAEVHLLGQWCVKIEQHYGQAMDIEWAKDGVSGQLYILQARPETVHSLSSGIEFQEYTLHTDQSPICSGKAVGRAIASGRACLVKSLADAQKVKHGDIIIADITNPDWNALLKKAVCIVTNKGGRTSHASIVARELGIHAVVGTGDATERIRDGQRITVSCAQGDIGLVYDGEVPWQQNTISVSDVPATITKPMLILADPDRAFRLAMQPNQGVGLLRMEFIINQLIRIHPMALVKFDDLPSSHDKSAIEAITRYFKDKKQYFIQGLSEGIATVAAAFYPREVIVRMSDFKSNEYAQLIGGHMFEPTEENPMLGFRGASRYYHPAYAEAFALECEAVKRVRNEMGLTNVKVMIPFCRTIEEGKKVLDLMRINGLGQGDNGLQVYVMAEIPSNVILASEFADLFDGFSIGSNDLTQLVLGIDRDSAMISNLFDERNPAVLSMLSTVIEVAHSKNKPIGLCGQAPSDFPEFTQFLVDQGIDSISFNPDAIWRGIDRIASAERRGKSI